MTAHIFQVTSEQLHSLISPEISDNITPQGWEILNRSFANSSEIWVGMDDDVMLGFWGLIPPTMLSNRAYIWFYSNPNLAEHSFIFVRHSQRVIERALQSYPLIVGHCLQSATHSQRWLRWLGARFLEGDGTFIPFEIKERRWRRQSAV